MEIFTKFILVRMLPIYRCTYNLFYTIQRLTYILNILRSFQRKRKTLSQNNPYIVHPEVLPRLQRPEVWISGSDPQYTGCAESGSQHGLFSHGSVSLVIIGSVSTVIIGHIFRLVNIVLVVCLPIATKSNIEMKDGAAQIRKDILLNYKFPLEVLKNLLYSRLSIGWLSEENQIFDNLRQSVFQLITIQIFV